MVPHLLGEDDGVGKRLPFGHGRRRRFLGSGDAVAIGAVAVGKGLLAAGGVAGLFEVAGGDEVGEQIGGLFRGHVALLNALPLHGGPHIGGVIPHEAGHHRGGIVAIHAAGEIGREGTAFPVQAVTLDALLAGEELLTTPGIAGDTARP